MAGEFEAVSVGGVVLSVGVESGVPKSAVEVVIVESVEVEIAGGVVLSIGVELDCAPKSAVDVVMVEEEFVLSGEEFALPDKDGDGLVEFVPLASIDVNTLAFLTAKAIQLNLMSSGADLLRTIVNPLTLFLVTR